MAANNVESAGEACETSLPTSQLGTPSDRQAWVGGAPRVGVGFRPRVLPLGSLRWEKTSESAEL